MPRWGACWVIRWATLASLLVSIVVVLPLLFVMRVPAPTVGAAVQGPAWLWLGGVAGVAYLTAALVLTPKLGASFIVSVMAGQMLASLVIDHFGLMGLAPKPIALGASRGRGVDPGRGGHRAGAQRCSPAPASRAVSARQS